MRRSQVRRSRGPAARVLLAQGLQRPRKTSTSLSRRTISTTVGTAPRRLPSDDRKSSVPALTSTPRCAYGTTGRATFSAARATTLPRLLTSGTLADAIRECCTPPAECGRGDNFDAAPGSSSGLGCRSRRGSREGAAQLRTAPGQPDRWTSITRYGLKTRNPCGSSLPWRRMARAWSRTGLYVPARSSTARPATLIGSCCSLASK